MSDTPIPQPENEQDVDAGPPIVELAGLEHEPSATFLSIIRRRIHRRSTASQLASFSWNMPGMIFLEFWNALIQLLGPRDTQKGGQA
jgi:hypothetical protein